MAQPKAKRRNGRAAVEARSDPLSGALAGARREVSGRVRRFQREAPLAGLQAVGELASALRDATGREVIDLAAMMQIAQFAYRQQELAQRGAEYEVDEFGFDAEWTESLLPLFQLMYERWWRVESSGVQNVPASGRALLVSNHAGVLPWDGAMIKTALFREHPEPRHARVLIAEFFFGLPGVADFLRRTGQTMGHPEDTRHLLEKEELVLVFPEGVKGTGKPWTERYRLRRFGRGGFAQLAIRTGSPLIPISVVGSEETYPMLGNIPRLARMFNLPYFPVTPFFPWLGPLGVIPLPSRWRIQFHEAIPTSDLDPELAEDQHFVMNLSDRVRDTIQSGVIENLRKRRSVFR
ncbi:MAG: lysophospholipid acyltransferase family protein [Candidatus Dormibacter sp.]|uniref:lysophospholipid acyltransferase family protein n=1 Tax=Candidatus Dormibacter sp. TaxID=2973982 RepID=UPI000DAFC8E4|nr:MAG: hypothetical protein DLM66_03835 [Candidatus Dormibacteraeota bacterium]